MNMPADNTPATFRPSAHSEQRALDAARYIAGLALLSIPKAQYVARVQIAVQEAMNWQAGAAAISQQAAPLPVAQQEAERLLGNLLARIHRDGGHYIAEHGLEKASLDAETQVVAWIAQQEAGGAASAGVAVDAMTLTDAKGRA